MNHDSPKYKVTKNVADDLAEFLAQSSYSSVFLLVDENTFQYCYQLIENVLPKQCHLIRIQSGESEKTLETVHKIWDVLFAHHADRKSLLINLGGGVISDMGGFAAATFKRGISFINIPTTLLAQVDAALGGKTGVNYGKLKNQIGVMQSPEIVLVSSEFLATLDTRQIFNGFAEMLKHAFIADATHLDELFEIAEEMDRNPKQTELLQSAIEKSIQIKSHVVEQDFNETSLRKNLNFGHTFGHAFESFFKETDNPLLHGEAVAQGIICELFLSNKILGLNFGLVTEYSRKILEIYGKISIDESDFEMLTEYMKHDKKNVSNVVKTSLLSHIGHVVPDCNVSELEIREALLSLNKLSK